MPAFLFIFLQYTVNRLRLSEAPAVLDHPLVTLLVGESLFALDKKSQGKYLPVELEQGIVGQQRPGLNLNPASLKISNVNHLAT